MTQTTTLGPTTERTTLGLILAELTDALALYRATPGAGKRLQRPAQAPAHRVTCAAQAGCLAGLACLAYQIGYTSASDPLTYALGRPTAADVDPQGDLTEVQRADALITAHREAYAAQCRDAQARPVAVAEALIETLTSILASSVDA